MKFRPVHFTIPIIIVIALFVSSIARSAEEPDLYKKIQELEDRQTRLVKFIDAIKKLLLKYKKEFAAKGIDIEELFKKKN